MNGQIPALGARLGDEIVNSTMAGLPNTLETFLALGLGNGRCKQRLKTRKCAVIRLKLLAPVRAPSKRSLSVSLHRPRGKVISRHRSIRFCLTAIRVLAGHDPIFVLEFQHNSITKANWLL